MSFIDPAEFREAAEAALAGNKSIRRGDVLISVWGIACEVSGWHQPMPPELCQRLGLRQRATYSDGGRQMIKILLVKQ